MRASSHLAEALKKTWDNSLNYSATSKKAQLGNFRRDLAHFHDHQSVPVPFLRTVVLDSVRSPGEHR